MADLAGIGQMLQGIGAGFSGQGPQYAQAQALQQEQAFLADDRRRQALIRDFAQVYSLGSAGQWDQAGKLLDNRIPLIQKLGGDPSDSIALRDRIRNGQYEEVKSELGAFIQAGILAGDIKPESSGVEGAKGNQFFKNGAVLQAASDRSLTLTTPTGVSITPSDPNWQQAISEATSSGIQYAGNEAAARANATQGAIVDTAAIIEMLREQGKQIGASGVGGAPSAADNAAAKTSAENTANAAADAAAQSKKNQKLWNAYKVASDNYKAALAKTATIPFGDGLKLTPEQQAASRARAQYGLALKRVTRDAGEGTFAKDDREAMMLGVPDIGDYQDARDVGFEMIDSTIRSGLGIEDGGAGGSGFKVLKVE